MTLTSGVRFCYDSSHVCVRFGSDRVLVRTRFVFFSKYIS